MWEQLRLNKARVIFVISISCTAHSLSGFCFNIIEDMHSTNTSHGLYEIREEAIKFIAMQNAINHTNWEIDDPDFRMSVPRCLVPLKVKWVSESNGLPNKSVMVYCTETSTEYSKEGQWNITLNIAPPLGSFELFFNIREAAVALLKQTHSKRTADFPSTDSFVGKCLVPLDATMNKNKSTVNVTCKKPLQTFFFKGDSWTVPVPISR